MKLLIVTVVEEFEKDILRLFKKANIESFSGSDIDGYKNHSSLVQTTSWFPIEKGGVESVCSSLLQKMKILIHFLNLLKNSIKIWKRTTR